jgi:hypothetical protein
MKECQCYVKNLSDLERFTIRYGAHGLDCPKYRESGDEVDRMYDEDTRSHHLMGRCTLPSRVNLDVIS